jgi:hypothetical protein
MAKLRCTAGGMRRPTKTTRRNARLVPHLSDYRVYQELCPRREGQIVAATLTRAWYTFCLIPTPVRSDSNMPDDKKPVQESEATEKAHVNPLNKLTEEQWKEAMRKGLEDTENQSASIGRDLNLYHKRTDAAPQVKALLDQVDSHKLSVTKFWELARAPEIRGRLQLIEHWLKDVESTFLEQLWLQPREPGSPAEAWALDQVEMYLQFAIVPQIEAVREIIAGHTSRTSS